MYDFLQFYPGLNHTTSGGMLSNVGYQENEGHCFTHEFLVMCCNFGNIPIIFFSQFYSFTVFLYKFGIPVIAPKTNSKLPKVSRDFLYNSCADVNYWFVF